MSNSVPERGGSSDDTPDLPWETLGKHSFCRVGDTYHLRTRGELDSSEMLALLDGMLGVVREWGVALLLLDAREGMSLSSEARQHYAEWARRHGFQPGSSAVVGANSTTWAVVRLITNAVGLIMRRSIPVRFFKHHADALAWLDSERQRWRAELAR